MGNNDDAWRHLTEGWERLSWARRRWQSGSVDGGRSAAAAALTLGMKEGTYRAYERPSGSSKHTPLDLEAARRFARAFNVNWTWLLTGEGTPYEGAPPNAIERVLRAMESMSEEQQNTLATMIEAFQLPAPSQKRRAQ